MSAVVDNAILAELREEGDDLLIDLIELFLRETPARMRVLAEALAAGDRELVERSTHTLKSTAATFGADALRAVAAEAETAARKAGLSRVAELMPVMEREVEQVRAALATERAKIE